MNEAQFHRDMGGAPDARANGERTGSAMEGVNHHVFSF
jgi:hypothetical protein